MSEFSITGQMWWVELVESRLIASTRASQRGFNPDFRISILESTLIYQHFYPEPLTPHPEPVEGAPPLLLLDSSTSPCQSPFIKASFLAPDHPLICLPDGRLPAS